MSGSLDLRAGDERPLVARGERVVTRGAVRALADALAARFEGDTARRALVSTDDPAVLLAVLDAGERTGTDVVIAHTALPGAEVDALVLRLAITCRVGDGGRVELLSPAPGAAPGPDPGDLGRAAALVSLMTSGTTGAPKVAEHTLASLLARARRTASGAASREGRWLLTYVPTGFAGLQVILTAALASGLIVAPEERTPSGFAAAATRWGVTHVSATPTFFRSLLMRSASFPARRITLGAEAVDQTTLDRVRRAFPGARVTHVYASTEAGVVFAVHDGRAGFPAAWLEAPPPGVALRVVDGYLHVRSDAVMRRYLTEGGQPRREDGWLETADRVEITGDRAHFLGRGDTTINVGGSKVYPLSVESFLLSLPDVVEARVYPVPSPVSGALVGAEVVLAPGASPEPARAAILAACRARLPRHEVPRVFQVVETIAVSASGKKG